MGWSSLKDVLSRQAGLAVPPVRGGGGVPQRICVNCLPLTRPPMRRGITGPRSWWLARRQGDCACMGAQIVRSTVGSACDAQVRGPGWPSLGGRCSGLPSDACRNQGTSPRGSRNQRSGRQRLGRPLEGEHSCRPRLAGELIGGLTRFGRTLGFGPYRRAVDAVSRLGAHGG